MAAFDHDARWEAASKLIRNRENVLNDVSNPSPMTQHELQRVTLHEKHYADEALREVARRMLGLREADEPISELRADPNHPSQVAVWSAVHQYFDGRIQSMPQQMPGRTPDLSGPASAVMKAVLKVGAGVCSWQPWAAYEDYMKSLDPSGNNDMQSRAEGAAGGHTHEARFEAAHRLIHNHEMVVRDICNPSTEKNIEGKPLYPARAQARPAVRA